MPSDEFQSQLCSLFFQVFRHHPITRYVNQTPCCMYCLYDSNVNRFKPILTAVIRNALK